MENIFISLTRENLEQEHLCCAIADKKHQAGVEKKKEWLSRRLEEGHVFRKLDEKGKVFIEYAPLETAWVPVEGNNFLYIYCLWVSGKFKGQGLAKALLSHCLEDAKSRGCSGVCVLSGKKKTPFLSDKKFFLKYGFSVADSIGDYELLSLSFDGSAPRFRDNARRMTLPDETLTFYYGLQCPYIPNCVEQIESYCKAAGVPYRLVAVDSLEKAKDAPCVFNNWAVFYNGEFETAHLLNEGYLKKLLERKKA